MEAKPLDHFNLPMIYTYMEYDNNAVIADSPAHYCGIAGIYSKEKINIPEKLFYAQIGRASCRERV